MEWDGEEGDNEQRSKITGEKVIVARGAYIVSFTGYFVANDAVVELERDPLLTYNS